MYEVKIFVKKRKQDVRKYIFLSGRMCERREKKNKKAGSDTLAFWHFHTYSDTFPILILMFCYISIGKPVTIYILF